MPFKLAPIILVASCFPTMAAAALPAQGNMAVVSGRAHVQQGSYGTYIHIERSGTAPAVTGLIPFGNQSQYPDLADLEGRYVSIMGVIIWDGRALIIMTAPEQLAVRR
jgi:hypothetical protein